LLAGGQDQFGVDFRGRSLGIENNLLSEDRKAHEFDAYNVPAAWDIGEHEVALIVGYGGVFFSGEGVRGSDAGARKRGFTAVSQAGYFVGVGGRNLRRGRGSFGRS